MEDWAYSGSWEGFPIINQCNPKTYGGYNKEQTNYTKRPSALRSIMFLLEVSREKYPNQHKLGRNHLDCIINLVPNPFFNTLTKDKLLCINEEVEGLIPKILRLSLALIDLLEPYINFQTKTDVNSVDITWIVGGAIKVDETFIVYDYVDDFKPIQQKLKKVERNSNILKMFKYKTKIQKGKAIWGEDFKDNDRFKANLSFSKKKKILVFVIMAKVDQNWAKTENSEPMINPQTHIVNLRTNENYKAKNGKYVLIGQKYFFSELGVVYKNKGKTKKKF